VLKQLFTRKPISLIKKEMAGHGRLRRILGAKELIMLGIGCIIGTGIFVLTGIAAHDKTGPAIILSYTFAGTACIFAALCYAEFASMVPVAGSAYTYAYATLGELCAWIIGWDLILEYTVASSTVAHGWSHYFQDFLSVFHLKIPHIFSNAPFDQLASGKFISTGTWFDLPAVVIALLITIIMVKGIKESAQFNNVMVLIKVSVVLFVIVVGAFYVDPKNWIPFAPYGFGGLSIFGHDLITGLHVTVSHPVGMLAGAGMVFFAYIGFDAVSTQAEEAKNPGRDVPIGIIASLIICTLLYIAVSAVLTGMVPYGQIDINAPVSNAFAQVGLPWAQFLVSLAAIAGITSVLLVLMLSQPRILLAMARDGLLPKNFFAAVHKTFKTPWKSSILTGLMVALMGGFLPLRILAELVNIGTLLAFVIVCSAVLIMRVIDPKTHRPFKVPFYPFTPLLGIGMCLLLMCALPPENWIRLVIWLAVGLVIYFAYGRRHSVMALAKKRR
jgi:APA family basic amino acid/polyamine antiporter